MGKIVRRVIGAVLIISALIVTQIPALGTNASSVSSVDFLRDKTTLAKFTGTAPAVSVPDDITAIGEEAFAGNQYIGVVNVGKNTTRIEHGAFANCPYLNKVSMGDSMKSIESAAFSACNNLASINIGRYVTDIGDGVFAGCPNLTNVTVDGGNNYFLSENQVLYNSSKSKLYSYFGGNQRMSYNMPNTIKDISPYSFWGNTNLEEVVLSGSLEKIPGYAFSNCKKLRDVTIPYSVNSIDAKAFENCVSLTKLTIPPSVKYIDETAFDGCTNLEIIAGEGTVAYDFYQNFKKNDVENTESQDAKVLVNQIGNASSEENESNDNDSDSSEKEIKTDTSTGYIDASKDPSNVEWMPSVDSLNSPEDSSVLGKTIVVSGRALFFIDKEMTVKEASKTSTNNDVQTNIGNFGVDDELSDSDAGTVIYDSGKGGYLPKYTEVNGRIAMQAFYGANDIDGYSVPEGITSIGRFAFSRSNITSIVIPEGVTRIGYGAFYHCDNLNSVTFPDSLEYIDAYAFDKTPFSSNFKSNVDGNGMLVVGDGILLAYGGKGGNVSIPSDVKIIAPACFMDNTSVTGVVIPDSVKTIGSDAFRGCVNLTTISGGNGIEKIEDRAFMGCPIGTFCIPSSVNEIGLRAIDYTGTDKTDASKVVVFEGTTLPSISYDDTSSRLSNSEYRKDVLHNVLFAVVDNSVNDFNGTVLDGDKLGFSGLILSKDLDANGNETGNVSIKQNYIYSEEVLNGLPDTIAIAGTNYSINDIDSLQAADLTRNSGESKSDVKVIVNGNEADDYKATFVENEVVGALHIDDSQNALSELNKAYSELFGGDTVDMRALNIRLYDSTDTICINKFGNVDLSVTVPIDNQDGTYHVVTLDEDGQLEELNASIDTDNNTITFRTNHLSYVGIYCNNGDSTLNVKDGRLVKNVKLDNSPNTGDNGIAIRYVLALALASSGLLLMLIRGKKKAIV